MSESQWGLTCWRLQDLKHMDAEVIFSKQLKQIEKEKKDKEIKLKVQEKKVWLID